MEARKKANGKVKELNREEGRALFDEQARRHLRMSGEEFIRAWDSGRFREEAERPEVIRLSMLLPFGR